MWKEENPAAVLHQPFNFRYSPNYMYDGKVYPNYLSGTGYLMDRSAALKLYHAALSTPFFHLEDVYITGNYHILHPWLTFYCIKVISSSSRKSQKLMKSRGEENIKLPNT